MASDALHVLFCKGILSHFLGSILHYICWRDGKGRVQRISPVERLGVVFEMIQEHYNAHPGSGSRLSNLKMSMFVNENKPHKQHPFLATKGNEMKHLLPAMLHACTMVLGTNQVEQDMLKALSAMVDLVSLFDSCGMMLTSSEHGSALRHAMDFLTCYQALNFWAVAQESQSFHFVPKFHSLWHMVEGSKWLNPRFAWCFKAEDYVGKISHLAHSVSMGVRSTKLCAKNARKYRYML